MSQGKYIGCIICILSFAAFLRASTPYPTDIIGDDATYAFRSVGYFDHMISQLQTTPYQWFVTPPWWVKLSFHDHPPLSFLLSHLAFRLFGMHTYVVRFIALIEGILTVWLVMLIAEKLGGKRASLLAGMMAATMSGLIWISRVALLESTLIPLILATFYAVLRSQEDKRWWWGVGVFFGLAFITKYTAIFLAPTLVMAIAHAIKDKKCRGRIVIVVSIILLIISPVVLYNVMLLKTRGHPDYQFSRLWQISTQDWRENFAQGRAFDGASIFSQLTDAISYAGVALSLAALLWLIIKWLRTRNRMAGLLLLVIVSLMLSMAWLGAKPWFAAPLLPFLCLSLGWAAAEGINTVRMLTYRKATWAMFMALWTAMAAYSANTHLFKSPRGPEGIAFAQTRTANFGYEQLDRYLTSIYQERGSAGTLWQETQGGKTLYIFDGNINYFPRIWYIQRRVTYQGIPFTSTQEFKKLVSQEGNDYFPSRGFTKYVFIHALSGALLVPEEIRDGVGDAMADALGKEKISGITISRTDGTPAFKVYEF